MYKLKKILSLILSLVLIIGCIQLPTMISADTSEKVVYVAANGSDTTGDGTQSNPYASISKAESVIEADADVTEGTVYITGSVDLTTSAHSKKVIITGAEGAVINGKSVLLNGPTAFENIKFNGTTFYTGPYEVSFTNVPMSKAADGKLFIGSNKTDTSNDTYKVIFNSIGTDAYTNSAMLRLNGNQSTINGNYNVTINGGCYHQVMFEGGNYTYNGNINITKNGGSINKYNLWFNKTASIVFNGAVQLVINDGTTRGSIHENFLNATAGKGKWIMYGSKTGGRLDVTSIPGMFKTNSEKVTKATNTVTGEVYYATPGTLLTVPEGEYNVTYEEANDENQNSGTAIRYVSETGSDSNDGLTEATAFASMSKALKTVDALNADTRILLVDGTVTYSGGIDNVNRVLIQGADSNAAIQLTAPKDVNMNYGNQYKVVMPYGPVTFDNINVKTSSDRYQILVRGQEVEFGNGCKFDVVNKYYLVGGTAKNSPVDSKLVLNTGITNAWSGAQVHFGQFNADHTLADKQIGRSELVVNGGSYRLLQLNEANYTKDVNIVINGGYFTTGNGSTTKVNLETTSVSNTTIKGALQLIFNNGYVENSDPNEYNMNSIIAEGGNWLIYGDKSGGQLASTETAGTFKVESTLYAKATLRSDTTKVYYGAPNGNIVLPEGTYDVTYTATPPGIFDVTVDGVSQGVYTEGSTFTLPAAPTKVDYEFTGWTDGTNTYAAGTTVTVESNLDFRSTWKTEIATAYVSSTGNDASGDGTQGNPYATIAKAQTVLDVVNAKERRVVLLNDTVATAAAHTNMITVRGNTNSIKLTGTLNDLAGPTTYENLDFRSTVYNNSNELVFGKNVKTYVGSMLNLGPKSDNATKRDNIVINSVGSSVSTYDVMLRIGAFNSSKVSPGFDLTINDGYFHQLYLQNNTIFNGNVNITINKAQIEAKGVLNGGKVTFNENAAFQIINNNGKGNKLFGDVFANIDVPAGKWFIYDEFVENTTGSYIRPEYNKFYGCKLEMTDTVGTYKIVNDSSLDTVYVSLTNLENPGTVYYSDNGYISVPAGEWYVTYMEELPSFVATGGEIYFNETVENFDFADVTSVYTEGKVIIGWKNGNTLAENGATFTKGTRLTAVYADTVDRYEGFKIIDKALRLDGKDGIRFTVKLNNSFYNALGGTEYGIIAIDEANVPYTVAGDIEIGGSYNGKSPAIIKADNKFLKYTDSVGYTVCLTGIDENNYNTDYMIRGYVKFTDLHGVERVIYTPFEQSNITAVVLEMLNRADVPAKAKEHIETVYKTVIDEQKAELAADYKAQLANNSKDAYGFTTLDNGVKVMNFVIDAVDGSNNETVTLSHVTDVHLNLLNKRDFANARPEVISFYRNRYHLMNGRTANATEKMMSVADALSDQVVLTGDTLDALNYGTLDLMKRLMITKYPNALHASGNHELWQDTGVGQISDTMTMDEKRAVYQEYMPHDSAYSTLLLKNKVLLIQMDNAVSWDEGSYSYSEEQYQALAKDLAIARENNYTVIIAQHLPLQFGVKTGANKNNNQILAADAPNNFSGNKVDMSSNDAYIMTDPDGSRGGREVATKTHRLITSYSDVVKGILCGHHHEAAVLDVIDIDTNQMTGIKQYMGGSAQSSAGIMFTFEIK